jgi:uncharacterized protein
MVKQWSFSGSKWLRGAAVRLIALVAVAALTLAAAMSPAPEKTVPQTHNHHEFFKIATGSVAGTYFPVGEALASLISHPPGAVRCEDDSRCGPLGLIAVAQASQGALRNVDLVEKRIAHSALAQSDIVQQAYLGEGEFSKDGAHENLRAIANLYTESIHIVVSRESGITNLQELKGKRVSVDTLASGTHLVAMPILKAAGLGTRDLKLAHLDVNQSADQILSGELDAFFVMGGPPVPAIESLAAADAITLLPLTDEIIKQMQRQRPYLRHTVISAGTYGNLGNVHTLGVGALWIVHKDAGEDMVYAITRALWNPENRALLASGQQQARVFTMDTATYSLPVPLHPGAERFYEEQGLLN